MRLYRASDHKRVQLGPVLGRGGEGAVHSVHGQPNLVAKIYLNPPTPHKVQKLKAMSRGAKPELLRLAAWPLDVLRDHQGVVRGFLMPRIDAREDIHELYSPKSRAATFPGVDFRFLVRVGANLARAFAVVHSLGHVIGDVNHGNALIGRDGRVKLIDCDSFQIRERVRTYTCDVGTPLFTAPELQGKAFRGLRRSANHDAFGLAVLLFHLFFMGRHPFAGRYREGEMSIERAIAESRFAYGPDSSARGMTAPPGTLPLEAFGPRIAALFSLAFSPASAGDRRPSALEWVAALEALESELVQCKESALHYHPAELSCCWCEVERCSGFSGFGRKVRRAARIAADQIEAAWQAITQVPRPDEQRPPLVPPFTPEHRWPPLLRAAFGVLRWTLLATVVVLCVVLPREGPFVLAAGVAWLVYRLKSWIDARRELKAARAQWDRLLVRWRERASSASFDKAVEHLRSIKGRLVLLEQLREKNLQAVLEQREARQQERYLDLFRIDKARLPGLVPRHIGMLTSYGLETAADVHRERFKLRDAVKKRGSWNTQTQVPADIAEALLAWYERHLGNFSFDPDQPLNPEDIAAAEEPANRQMEELIAELRRGPEMLRSNKEYIEQTRAALRQEFDAAGDKMIEAQKKASELTEG